MRKKLCILLLFGALCVVRFWPSPAVGPEYDEVLAVNAVLGCPHPSLFLTYSKSIAGYCIPLMLMPYIGLPLALPLYLTSIIPDFTIIDLRLMNQMLVVLGSLFFSYVMARRTDKITGFILLFLLLLDPALFWSAEFESVTVMPFLLRLLLLSLTLFVSSRSQLQTFGAGLVSGLLIWTKVDAVFFLLAFAIPRTRLHTKKDLPLVVGLGLGSLPFLLYLRRYWRDFLQVGNSYSHLSFSLIQEKLARIGTQLSTADFYQYVTLDQLPFSQPILVGAGILFSIWVGASLIIWKREHRARPLITTIIIFYLLYLLYGGLQLIHHRLLIYPLPHLILALAISKATTWIRHSVLLGSAILFFFIFWSWNIGLSRTCGGGGYTCATFTLFSNVASSPAVITGDWGIATPLLFLSKGTLSITELSFDASAGNTDRIDEALVKSTKICGALILRPSEQMQLSAARSAILSRIETALIPELITDRHGNPRYEVYRLCPPTTAR